MHIKAVYLPDKQDVALVAFGQWTNQVGYTIPCAIIIDEKHRLKYCLLEDIEVHWAERNLM